MRRKSEGGKAFYIVNILGFTTLIYSRNWGEIITQLVILFPGKIEL
jgi:hypothetical protein